MCASTALVFVCLLSSDLKNPEIVTLRNLTKDSAGVYKCTASNDVGEESCTVEVKMHCEWRRFLFLRTRSCPGAMEAAWPTAGFPHLPVCLADVRGMGVMAGAVVGVSFGVLLIILIIWLVFRKKEMQKYEEEETPNEIR